MTRRELAKKTIGALFSVSSIPAFGSKPKLFIPPVNAGKQLVKVDWYSQNQLWISA